MTVFWFALCVLPVDTLARCYHWDREVCESYFEICYEGRVPTPIFRKIIQ